MEASALRHPTRTPALTGRSPLLRLQSDEKLIALIRRGHQGAFEVLVQRYTSRLQAFCRHMLGSTEDAEDVLQEVFASAFNAICADERPINARPWLYRIARNRCLNHLRRPAPAGQDSMDVFERDGGTTTADAVHKREEFRHIVLDVQALPETQRTALLLREMDALSYEQISEAMDTTVPSVKSLLVRARVSLAEAGEARLLSCEDVRLELGEVAEGLRRSSAPARRHVRGCERCRNFKCELARANKALAAVYPIGALVVLQKLLLVKFGLGMAAGHGAAAGGSAGLAGGAAASSSALVAGGGAAAGGGAVAAASTGALSGGGAIASAAAVSSASAAAGSVAAAGAGGGAASAAVGALSAGVGTLAGKAAAGLAAAAIVTAGAVEVDHVARDSSRSATTPALVQPAPGVTSERVTAAEPPRAKAEGEPKRELASAKTAPAAEAPAADAEAAEAAAAAPVMPEAGVADPALEPVGADPAVAAPTTPAPGAAASPPVAPAPSIDATTGGTAAPGAAAPGAAAPHGAAAPGGAVPATPAPAPTTSAAPRPTAPAGETVTAPTEARPLPVAGETVVPAGQ